MATYTGVRSKSATLTAGVVDVITLDKPYRIVRITSRGTDGIWYTIALGRNNEDNVTPTVGGDGVYYLGPGASVDVQDDQYNSAGQPASIVQLISQSAVAYTVTGIG